MNLNPRSFRAVLFGLASQLAVVSTLAATTPVDKPWEDVSRDHGILVQKKEIENSDIVAFRGETIIPAPLAKVAGVLNDSSRRTEWISDAKEARDIRVISPLERIEYNLTGTPWPLKNREFLYRVKVTLNRDKKEMRIHLKSVEDESVPESDKAVRGDLEGNYVLTSVDGDTKTHLIVEILADPKGSIPKWVVNMVQKGWPQKTLEGIARQSAKPDVKEMVVLRDYFSGAVAASLDVAPERGGNAAAKSATNQ